MIREIERNRLCRVSWRMQSVSYYLMQAGKAERLALLLTDERTKHDLLKMAEDYRDIAQDLENGAIEVRHPERMPQLD